MQNASILAMNVFFQIWPTWAALARDLDAPYPTVNSWSQRGIPPKRFREIIVAAEGRGVELSYDQLEAINSEIIEPKKEDAA